MKGETGNEIGWHAPPNLLFALRLRFNTAAKWKKEMECYERSQGQTLTGSGVLKGTG